MADVVDVCVVGSGAGGAPVALACAEAGMRVVVLEKGPWYRQKDLLHDEIAVVRRNFFVPFVADEPHLVRTKVTEAAEQSTFGWISCCVGGGTVHWAGYAMRFSPDDFRRKTLTGGMDGTTLADWPITYDELEPWYEKAEREIGVAGVLGASPFDPPRKSDYPLPPLVEHPVAKLVDEAGRKSGVTPFPTPRALLSRPYQGRSACMYCDFCASYGCEMGAKGSTADALLPRAVATGRCEVKTGCMAREVRVDERGRATGVVYRDADGVEQEQRARVVVLACSAVETPRLLLNSISPRFPDGLANFSGQVGKNLMLLTRSGVRADLQLEGRAPELRSRHPFVGRAIRDAYASAGAITVDFLPMSPIWAAERLSTGEEGRTVWGKALKDRLRRYYREAKHLECEGYSECLPMADNFVDVEPDVTDRHGLPVARVTFAHHYDDLERSTKLADVGRQLFEAMGADAIDDPMSGGTFDVLQSGTCRMGDDPSTSVLDKRCRTHDVSNLYVTDGSVFPTSGAVPPTLTIMANAFRVANGIVERGKRRELD